MSNSLLEKDINEIDVSQDNGKSIKIKSLKIGKKYEKLYINKTKLTIVNPEDKISRPIKVFVELSENTVGEKRTFVYTVTCIKDKAGKKKIIAERKTSNVNQSPTYK